jgi:membrane peptidoglycan carboxypeptidase
VKASRSAAHLRAMVQVRLITQPEAQRRIAESPQLAPEAGQVISHERDSRGRNWDIQELQRGEGLERTFRAIVDALREAFDLA